MSERAMPTRSGHSLSCSIHISPLCCGGSWWRLPRMGACATVMCQPKSASLCISIHIYTGIRDGLCRVSGAHGQ